jgi:hypothetical protein
MASRSSGISSSTLSTFYSALQAAGFEEAVEDAELVDGENVGMVECRSGLGFLLEALQPV